jgi:hypothetical protein
MQQAEGMRLCILMTRHAEAQLTKLVNTRLLLANKTC